MVKPFSLDGPLRVYFAGKVNDDYEPDFWRRDWFGIEQDSNGSISEHVFGQKKGFSAIYGGPMLFGQWEDGGHTTSQVMHHAGATEKPHNAQLAIYEQCVDDIRLCDLVVARLSDRAYGTMFEVGYANALNKQIVPIVENHDMWFASPNAGWYGPTFAEAKLGFIRYVEESLSEHWFFHTWKTAKCESPIESLVCEAMYLKRHWRFDWSMLDPQHCACGFRIDLAIPRHKLAFEFDGFTYHSDKASFNRDRERDRKLSEHGWTVIRFHGDEIRLSANAVATQIRKKAMDCEHAECK